MKAKKPMGPKKEDKNAKMFAKESSVPILSVPEYQSGQGPVYQRLQKSCALASLI